MSPINTKNDILDRILANKSKLAEFGIQRLGLFGSFGNEMNDSKSDIDLIIEFQPNSKNYDNFFQTNIFLEDILGKDVDLVTKESLSPYLKDEILNSTEYVQISN